MGQKITSDGSDSKRQINLEKLGAAGQVFRVLGFRRKVRDFHRPREYVCVGKWFAWVACEYLSPRHLQTFPKRINEDSTLPSVPGAHFFQTNREKASFHSFPRLSLIANSLRRLKVQVMADLFYCKQDSGGCESCRHYLARFSRLRAFGNIFVKKNILASRCSCFFTCDPLSGVEHFILFNFRSNKSSSLHEAHCVRLFGALTDYRWDCWTEMTSDCLCCDFFSKNLFWSLKLFERFRR